MSDKERLLLSLGVTPQGATRKTFERQMVKVTPKNGQPSYETWLLSQMEDENGIVLVYYVSGIEALFPNEVTMELITCT